MIERLFLPQWAMAFEDSVDKVGGATFDEPHNLRQAHQPSFSIPKGCEEQVHVRGHHHHCV